MLRLLCYSAVHEAIFHRRFYCFVRESGNVCQLVDCWVAMLGSREERGQPYSNQNRRAILFFSNKVRQSVVTVNILSSMELSCGLTTTISIYFFWVIGKYLICTPTPPNAHSVSSCFKFKQWRRFHAFSTV